MKVSIKYFVLSILGIAVFAYSVSPVSAWIYDPGPPTCTISFNPAAPQLAGTTVIVTVTASGANNPSVSSLQVGSDVPANYLTLSSGTSTKTANWTSTNTNPTFTATTRNNNGNIGSCTSSTYTYSCPAEQSCPTTCHTDTQYVPNGACGNTTCFSNAPAYEADLCTMTPVTRHNGDCTDRTLTACTTSCSGPGNTCVPANCSISGVMYTNPPYTGGFSVWSSAGTAHNGNASGGYSITDIPYPATANITTTFGVPPGYRITNAALAGWSCGGSWAQGQTCPGPSLYGTVQKDSCTTTGVDIFAEQIPTISGRVRIDYDHTGADNVPFTAGAHVELSNLLTNSSFETWSNVTPVTQGGSAYDNRSYSDIPSNWAYQAGSGGVGSRYNLGGHSGTYGWLFTTGAASASFTFAYQNVSVLPNTQYTFSGWMLPWDNDNTAIKKLCVTNTSNTPIQACATFTNLNTNGQWYQLTTTFNSGSNTTVRLAFGTNYPLTQVWDDFTLTQKQTTDASGAYSFTNLPYGTYTVKLTDDSPGYTNQYARFTQERANSFTTTLSASAKTAGHDFTTAPLYTVSGNVFNDVNSNSRKDVPPDTKYPDPTSQPGVPNATITLGNFLYNPSFETWSNGVGSGTTNRAAPDGWTMTPVDGYSRRETPGYNDSYNWMRTDYGSSFVWGQQDVRVKPDTNYKLTGQLAQSSFAPGVSAKICASTTSNIDIQCAVTTTYSPGWQQLKISSFNSGANTTIRIRFGTNSNQTALWDDFNLSEIQTTDASGAYSFINSVMSSVATPNYPGNYTANFTPSSVLYNTIEAGTYTASPTLDINRVNTPSGTKNLYALVVIPPPPIIIPSNLSIVPTTGCMSNNYNGSGINISWTNNAFPVTYVDISTDNFTTYYHKSIVSGATTTDGTGFGGFQGVTGTLTYTPSTFYYVRLWNGGLNGTPASFTIPICPPSAPTGPLTAVCPSPGETVNLSWSATTDATFYYYTIEASDEIQTSSTTASYTPTTPNATHAWNVQACNATGCSSPPTPGPSFFCSLAKSPWIQTVGGDVHSNTGITQD